MSGTIFSFAEHYESVHVFSQSFQSDPFRDQKPMSKSGQDQNFDDGSATAKPKPMSSVQAEARPRIFVCLTDPDVGVRGQH